MHEIEPEKVLRERNYESSGLVLRQREIEFQQILCPAVPTTDKRELSIFQILLQIHSLGLPEVNRKVIGAANKQFGKAYRVLACPVVSSPALFENC